MKTTHTNDNDNNAHSFRHYNKTGKDENHRVTYNNLQALQMISVKHKRNMSVCLNALQSSLHFEQGILGQLQQLPFWTLTPKQ